MPWVVRKTDQCPASKPYGVFTEGTERLHGCHPTQEAARKQQAALYVLQQQGKIKATRELFTVEQWQRAMEALKRVHRRRKSVRSKTPPQPGMY